MLAKLTNAWYRVIVIVIVIFVRKGFRKGKSMFHDISQVTEGVMM